MRYQTTVRLGDLKPYIGRKGCLALALTNLMSAISNWDLKESEVQAEINKNGAFKLTTDDGRKCTIRPVK